jgi:3-isopropylmalate/(R)-2-methylmalate dehydratase small subunit
MQPFTAVEGPAIPLLLANVDTDAIIPIQDLLGAGRQGLGARAFARLRYREDGSERPEFPPHLPAFRGSPILLALENFGCGSSREGAVWALMGMGLRAVIAPSFGDIFFANCFQNGLLPVRLPAEAVRHIADQGARPTRVDLEALRVTAPDGTRFGFEVDARRREALLRGLDDISLTLERAAEIEQWRARDRAARPWASASVAR